MPGLLDKVIENKGTSRGNGIRLAAGCDALDLAYEGAQQLGLDVEKYDDLFTPDWLKALEEQERLCEAAHKVEDAAIIAIEETRQKQIEFNSRWRQVLDGKIRNRRPTP